MTGIVRHAALGTRPPDTDRHDNSPARSPQQMRLGRRQSDRENVNLIFAGSCSRCLGGEVSRSLNGPASVVLFPSADVCGLPSPVRRKPLAIGAALGFGNPANRIILRMCRFKSGGTTAGRWQLSCPRRVLSDRHRTRRVDDHSRLHIERQRSNSERKHVPESIREFRRHAHRTGSRQPAPGATPEEIGEFE